MSAPMQASIDYGRLVQQDQVHGSVYTSPQIFEDEMDRIFRRGWVYVGHASEVPTAGDFVTRMIGLQAVVMTRDKQGGVNVMYNRCPHRGNKVCQAEKGHASTLTCSYHGWAFGMDGALAGVPFPQGYGTDFDRSQHGMVRVPRVESYGGFVFASLCAHGEKLAQHLGEGARMIDMLNGLSPEGGIELTAGWMKHQLDANWKVPSENQVDGYHAMFVHGSLARANDAWAKVRDRRENSTARTRDLGAGHSEIDHAADYAEAGTPFRWTGGVDPARLPQYVAAMQKAYGQEEAQRRMVLGPPHAAIFPNLMLAEMNISILQPVSATETIQYTTPVMLKGGAELNARSLRRCEGALGPAGFLIADDAEVNALLQQGLATTQPEWVVLKRGLHSEKHEADGSISAGLMDETSQRGLWRRYRQLMTAVA
ncbi:Rieske 2Fe-2S domain-containing protein [Comamonadaceae bacterium G21597-S1]|nr:Rieske 2Fe-2S domain-containing protein [Comamonadaceae bacterium G21597-S1]